MVAVRTSSSRAVPLGVGVLALDTNRTQAVIKKAASSNIKMGEFFRLDISIEG
jgi:hypothetical protein